MSLIPCTDPCIYQLEGCCTLERACSAGTASPDAGCVHFLPRSSQKDRQGLPDVPYRDQRQAPRGRDGLPPVTLGHQALGKAQPPDL